MLLEIGIGRRRSAVLYRSLLEMIEDLWIVCSCFVPLMLEMLVTGNLLTGDERARECSAAAAPDEIEEHVIPSPTSPQ